MGQSLHQIAVVVEDDVLQREMIAVLLEESEFDVIQCGDAETALLAVKMRHPSFLVTDVNLNGKMDGIELAHLAREQDPDMRVQDPDMRVVVISGQEPARGLPDGAKFYAKPVHPMTLLREAAH